jgi:hypothetical protein
LDSSINNQDLHLRNLVSFGALIQLLLLLLETTAAFAAVVVQAGPITIARLLLSIKIYFVNKSRRLLSNAIRAVTTVFVVFVVFVVVVSVVFAVIILAAIVVNCCESEERGCYCG